MSRRNYVENLEYGLAEGMDTTSSITKLAPGFVLLARNYNLDATGGWISRGGSNEQLTTPWGSRSIRGGIQFRTETGIDRIILYGTDDVGDGRLGFVDGGGVTDIRINLSAVKRPSLIQMDDRLFFFNEDSSNSPFVYDGTLDRDLGLTPPAASPGEASQDTNGDLVQMQTYVYFYAYIRRVGGRLEAISSPSAPLTVTLTSTNDEVNLDLVASAEVGVTAIQLFRTPANGNQGCLLDEIANTSTYKDILPDSALTTAMPLDNSKITDFASKPAFAIIAQNRIFLVTGDNELRYSKIGNEGPLPESYTVRAKVDTQGKFGNSDKIIGLGTANDIPIIIKERSIGRLDTVGIPDFGGIEDNVLYLYKELDTSTTAVSHWSGVEVQGNFYWLGKKDVHQTDGRTTARVGGNMRNTIQLLGFHNTDRFSGIVDTQTEQIKFSTLQSSAEDEPNFILVGDYKQFPKIRWTIHGPGGDPLTHPSIRAASFFEVSGTDGIPRIFFGNTDKNGQYSSTEDGLNDNDDPISLKLVTRPTHMERPTLNKLFKTAEVQARSITPQVQLEMCTIYDLSNVEEFCRVFDIPTVGGNWDDKNWAFDDENDNDEDTLIWAGEGIEPLNYHAHRKARWQQLVFNQDELDKPVEIIGWSTSGSIFGQSDETT